jgi:hypothetical protein
LWGFCGVDVGFRMYRVVNYSDKVFVLEILDAWRVVVLMEIIRIEEGEKKEKIFFICVIPLLIISRFQDFPVGTHATRPMMSYEAGRNQTPE